MAFSSEVFGFNVGIRKNVQRPEIVDFICSLFCPTSKAFYVKLVLRVFFSVTLRNMGGNVPFHVDLSMA